MAPRKRPLHAKTGQTHVCVALGPCASLNPNVKMEIPVETAILILGWMVFIALVLAIAGAVRAALPFLAAIVLLILMVRLRMRPS